MAFKMKGPSLYTDPNGFRKGHNQNKKTVKVPSGKITMTEKDGSPLEAGPLYGTGTSTGKTILMKPGKNYEFAGDNEVVETKPPLKQKESKSKWRKDGTLKKVVTRDRKTGYRSIIRFDKEGRIKSAKNNQTKNKHRKSVQRLSKAQWIKEDMSKYSNDPNIVSTKDYSPKKDKKKKKETAEEKRNRIYNRG